MEILVPVVAEMVAQIVRGLAVLARDVLEAVVTLVQRVKDFINV